MSDKTPIHPGGQGLTRRELLRKGAVLGGALAWSIPTVQTIRMAPAFAAATSFAVSYMAMVIKCTHDGIDKFYRAKYDVGEGWSEGGQLPCGSDQANASWPAHDYSPLSEIKPLPSPTSTPISGDKVKWTFDFRAPFQSGNCTVDWSLNKCAQICESGPTGQVVTFEPCPAP